MAAMSPLEALLVNRATPWFYRRALGPFFAGRLTLPARSSLLELGCGNGHAALLIDRFAQPARFVATDYDAEQVERARATIARADGEQPAHLALAAADALALPHPPEAFDAVFAFFVLHHLPETRTGEVAETLRTGLTEIARVLKPGGQFVYGEIRHRRIIRELLGTLGYRITHRRVLLGFIDLVIARKG